MHVNALGWLLATALMVAASPALAAGDSFPPCFERALAADAGRTRPPFASWIGTWRHGDNWIALTLEGDRISAEGEAYWPGKNIMPANEGSFAGTAAPSANRLRIVDNSCEVGMTLAGRFLVVTDNQMCGGHNVSFSGIYVRQRDRVR
jgi:hypothetical protein